MDDEMNPFLEADEPFKEEDEGNALSVISKGTHMEFWTKGFEFYVVVRVEQEWTVEAKQGEPFHFTFYRGCVDAGEGTNRIMSFNTNKISAIKAIRRLSNNHLLETKRAVDLLLPPGSRDGRKIGA
jgi:hypothetical protein